MAGVMLGTMLGLSPAHAAERFFCAASDAVADMSIDISFDGKEALKLSHFRGVVGMKSDDAPRETRKIEINSSVLTQYWMDGDELKFRVRILTPPKRPTSIVDIALDTERGGGDTDRFTGTYALSLSRIGATAGAGTQQVETHQAPVFCSIKR